MAVDLWELCRQGLEPKPMAGELVRIVESQEQIATAYLVDDLAEQALLETLLERSKPPLRPGTEGLHFLLATPFRYPPLPHGSRFGTRHEPGLLYGSLTWVTALAETAYYRLVFWSGMEHPPPSGKLLSRHTALGIEYQSESGLGLQYPPCAEYRETLTDPEHYTSPQRLGAKLRELGIEVIEYPSARDPGLNAALLTPQALARPHPSWQQAWLCETRSARVQFSGDQPPRLVSFPLQRFLIAGRLPQPAV
jgi:hypothetical protein